MRTEKTRLLRSGAAAKRLGLHPLTVRRWVKEGKIAAIPIGREARITRTGVERLLGQQRAGLMASFSGYGVTLTRLSPDEDNTPEPELSEDVRAISAAFAGRLYGLRSRKHQGLIVCAKHVLIAKAQE